MKIDPRRMTAQIEGDFVVFLIGMRVNSWWRIGDWMPVARGMRRMLKELLEQPDLGLLGHEQWFSNRIAIVVQYWRSTDHLMRYAHAKDAAHLPAWRTLNQRMARAGRGVGFWHETYQVAAGQYETIYRNMPAFGLGKASALVEAAGRRSTARGRLGQPEQEQSTAA
jgi:hypothetical protein